VVLGLGLIIPMVIIFYSHIIQLEGASLYNLLSGGAILELIGGFFLRFSILRAGVYNPIL
jgi:formate-dependent nitrite reductase membrane component NrfD